MQVDLALLTQFLLLSLSRVLLLTISFTSAEKEGSESRLKMEKMDLLTDGSLTGDEEVKEQKWLSHNTAEGEKIG